jgi:hypothetical protein
VQVDHLGNLVAREVGVVDDLNPELPDSAQVLDPHPFDERLPHLRAVGPRIAAQV